MKTGKSRESAENSAPKRVLLAQCCHLPQWFFLGEELQRRHPHWIIDGLALDHPHTRRYLRILSFPGRVYLAGTAEGPVPSEYDRILIPLVNRGYLTIKRQAWRLGLPRYEIDYQGKLYPLPFARMIRSVFLPRHRPTPEFVDYLEEFPHQPLGEKIFIAESCRPELLSRTAECIRELVPTKAEITRSGPDPKSLRRLWKEYGDKTFDSAVVYFSGERGYLGLKLFPFLKRIPKILIVNENGQYFYSSTRSMMRFLWMRLRGGLPGAIVAPRILLFQTEVPQYIQAAAKRLKGADLFPDAQIRVICREGDRSEIEGSPYIDEVISYSKSHPWQSYLRMRKAARSFRPDFNAGVFTGRRVFFPLKAAFFWFGSRRRFILNAQLDGYWFAFSRFRRLMKPEPLLPELVPPSSPKILLIQTETVEFTREVLKRISRPELYPESRVALLARVSDRDRFSNIDSLDEILTYDKKHPFRTIFQLYREVRKKNFEIKCASFTGRPVYRLGKLIFWILPVRCRLAFNAGLDGYWLNLRTVHRIFKQEPFAVGLPGIAENRILLIETEEPEIMQEAVDRMRQTSSTFAVKIILFCADERSRFYTALPGIERIITYSKENSRQTGAAIRQLIKERPEAVSAVFSGRRIFLKHKLLFWCFPVRSRLVFNRHLDCDYLRLGNLRRLFRSEARSAPWSAGRTFLYTVLRATFFLPRFFYLIIWKQVRERKRNPIVRS